MYSLQRFSEEEFRWSMLVHHNTKNERKRLRIDPEGERYPEKTERLQDTRKLKKQPPAAGRNLFPNQSCNLSCRKQSLTCRLRCRLGRICFIYFIVFIYFIHRYVQYCFQRTHFDSGSNESAADFFLSSLAAA